MLSRFLTKRIEIEAQEIPGGPGNTLELEYYLVESEPAGEDAVDGDRGYGIAIVKKKSGAEIESAIFRDVFRSRAETEKLVALMAEHTVTPVTLPYVLEDYIG